MIRSKHLKYGNLLVRSMRSLIYDNIAIPIKKFPNSIDGSVFVFGGKHLQMAEGLFSYVGIPAIDFTNFLAGNIVSMAGMFTEFRTDGSLDLSGLDASRVWNMDEMFRTCDVHGLDISSFDLTDKHTYRMFTDCSAQEIIIPSDFLHGAMKIYHDLIYSVDFEQEKICLFLENRKLFKQLDETHSEEDSERLYQETGIRISFNKTYYQRMESCS